MADGGLGFTTGVVLISMSCSTVSSFPLIGSVPFSEMYFSISLRSNIQPETGETTGCSGTSLDTACEVYPSTLGCE